MFLDTQNLPSCPIHKI